MSGHSGEVRPVLTGGADLGARPSSPAEADETCSLVHVTINTMTYISCNSFGLLLESTSRKGGGLCPGKAHTSFSWTKRRKTTWSVSLGDIRHRIAMSCAPRSSYSPPRASPTRRSESVSTCQGKSSRSGENASSRNAWPDFRNGQGAGGPALFPPEIVMEIKALACQLPKDLGLPFSRLGRKEIAQEAVKRGIVPLDQRNHGLALAQRRCHPPLVLSQLDLAEGS